MDELLQDFLTETHERIEQVDAELVAFERRPDDAEVLDSIFRLVHTIKGTCGFLGLDRLEALSHAGESLLGRFRDGAPVTREAVSLILVTIDRIKLILAEIERLKAEPAGDDADLIARLSRMVEGLDRRPGEAREAGLYADGEQALGDDSRAAQTPDPYALAVEDQERDGALEPQDAETGHARVDVGTGQNTIRVNVEVIDQLMTTVSELVLTRNQLLDLSRRVEDGAFKVPLQRLSNITAELQDGVMKTRMQPIRNLWRRLPRLVRDLAEELGKEVNLHLTGGDTELDRQLIELIKDPLTHMIRNAIDHGVERPQERIAAGKARAGNLRISAAHEGGSIIIEMSDDGRGLDYGAIRDRAAARGLADPAELARMTEAQLARVIFLPGFSTAAEVSAVSGRGVGMDVVKTNVERIGGVVAVRSTPGRGASFQIKIPLTLAIVTALLVEAGGQRFAIPQSAVVEIVRAGADSEHRVDQINGAAVLALRDQTYPLAWLSERLGLPQAPAAKDGGVLVVVVRVGGRRIALGVDGVSHAEEIVVKPLSSALRHIPLYSGATILGDGAVILILDPNGLGRALGVEDTEAGVETSAEVEAEADEQATPLLVFRAGPGAPKAIPLSLVARLEEIDASAIEGSEGRFAVRHRDGLMPLIPAADGVERVRQGAQPILIVGVGERMVGLMVDAVVDIVEERVTVELPTESAGLIGAAVVRGRVTELIDLGALLQQHDPGGVISEARNRRDRAGRRVLLVQASAFFQALAAPALRAAGYAVDVEPDLAGARARLRAGRRYAGVVLDADHVLTDGAALDDLGRHGALIGLASDPTDPDLDMLRHAGMARIVGKFDRRGLVSALDGTGAAMEAA